MKSHSPSQPRPNPWRPIFLSTALALLSLALSGCQSTDFYPIGIYAVPGTNDLAVVREAGFNLVRGPANRAYLDEAGALGLGVLATPGTAAGHRFNAGTARRVVAEFDAHPALWGWYISDEPELHGVTAEEVRNAHLFLKRNGAKKPTALVIYQGERALDYANIADITMIDRYPIPWLPLASFPQHVRMTRLALGKEKPMIAVIQAFDWTYYPEHMPYENLRPPTFEELRCMTYLALAHRANGIFYYCYADSRWKIRDHPETWEALQRVVGEVNDRTPLFQAEHFRSPFLHRLGDPSLRFNAALESSMSIALLRVRAGNAAVPPGNYLLAINTTPYHHMYNFRLPRLNPASIPVLGEDRELRTYDDWWEDYFAPFDARVYGPL